MIPRLSSKTHPGEPPLARAADETPPDPPWLARALWALLAVAALSLLAFPGARALFETDEARNAEIAREMVTRHDWVTPHLYHFKYLEKPPLFFWLLGGSIALFGASEAPVRIPVVAIGFLTIAATMWYVSRVATRRRALLAGLVLAASGGFFIACRAVVLDALFMMFVSSALFLFHAMSVGRAPRSGASVLALYALLGLAVLTKGPTGLAFPLLITVVYIILTNGWRSLRRTISLYQPFFGVSVILAINVPWYLMVSLRNPEFLHFFFKDQHFDRFFTKDKMHNAGWYYFLPITAGELLPWTILAPAAALGFRKSPLRDEARIAMFGWIIAALYVGIFSCSGSKLPTYVLPAVPALAVLASGPLDRLASSRGPRPNAYATVAAAFGAACLAVAATGLSRFWTHPDPRLVALETAVRLGFGVLGASVLASALCALASRSRPLSPAIAAAGTAVAMAIVFRSGGALDSFASPKPVARALVKNLREGDVVVDFGRARPGLLYYTGLRPLYVGRPGELKLGIKHPKQRDGRLYLPEDAIGTVFARPERVLCVLRTKAIPDLERYGVSPHVLWGEGDYALVSNRPD